MFTFIHAADVHLDSRRAGFSGGPGEETGSLRGEFAAAPRRALENLVDEALRRRADLVVIAGDLYDGDWEDYSTGHFLTRQMQRLQQRGTPVFVVSGNHDAANRMTKSLRLPDNVRWFSSEQPETFYMDEWKVAVHGRSFQDRAEQQNLAEQYPAAREGWFNIGVLHTSAHLGGGEHDPYAPCSLESLLGRGYDYWALGHIHHRQVLHAERPVIAYSGNLQGRHVRETGAKGCWWVEVDSQGTPRLEFLAVDVARWERAEIDASGCGSPEAVLERAEEALSELRRAGEGRPQAVRLEIVGPCPAHDALLAESPRWTAELINAASLLSDAIWVESVRWRTSPPPDAAQYRQGADELTDFLHRADQDPEVLRKVMEALEPLREKLPREVFEQDGGPASGGWNQPEVAGDLIRQAQAVLRHRLDSLDLTGSPRS